MKAIIDANAENIRQNEWRLEQELIAEESGKGSLWKEIRALKFESLLAKLKSGEIKSIDALQAYQFAALKVNSRLNCIVHVSIIFTRLEKYFIAGSKFKL